MCCHVHVVQGLNLLLNGLSAAIDGKKSAKTRATNAQIWGEKRVLPEMVAFVATGACLRFDSLTFVR